MTASDFTPQDFVARWQDTELNERQTYQMHFADVCRLVGFDTPDGSGDDGRGNRFVFERSLKKDTGGQGYADVYLENHFAIEYKAPGKYKNLTEAYRQLQQYREQLNNPPLLVVTDIQTWEVHTNWSNTEKRVYRFSHEEIGTRGSVLETLRYLFHDPRHLHPRRNTAQVTADAAAGFQVIADNMRDWEADPERIAHFLTKLVFCLFAEDTGLLPTGQDEAGIFTELVKQTRTDSERFVKYATELFRAMADGGEMMYRTIPYFNGSLFDDVRVETLSLEALSELWRISRLNWESVEPAIFGTLFERSLDPSKRAQLGAHYTHPDDILLIVEPVLMQPLRREWARIRDEAMPVQEKYQAALQGSNRRSINAQQKKLEGLRETMLAQVRSVRVMDPACGSGNFLYMALQQLMDFEKAIITDEAFTGLVRPFPEVSPKQLYGMEKDPIAHALASIVVWIGYLQWQQQNGFMDNREPILEDLSEQIVCKDAILAFDEDGEPLEPDWAAVDVIIGNPPFLGGAKILSELGEQYQHYLWQVYEDRVPGSADLVTYWFERSRAQIEQGKAKRAGLLATNSIRGGANREVLKRIKDSGDIFMAWSDREWVLEGAAVRVSMVGFDDGTEQERLLNNLPVDSVHSDITGGVDILRAIRLAANADISFRGTQKGGAFDITEEIAQSLLASSNKSGLSNADVVKPWVNGTALIGKPRANTWIIDFGINRDITQAEQYEAPFAYVKEHVYPKRSKNRRAVRAKYWWLHSEVAPGMREAIDGLTRYIATPRIAKYRVFVWVDVNTLADDGTYIFGRDDDYFFGVLHSKLHEVWSLRMGTWLGKGNDPRYTPTTTFETFPFPWSPGEEDTESAAYQAIAAAAKQLNDEREAWLNPPGLSKTALKARTLTNLYNALAVYRGEDSMKIKPEAGDFAPRLDELHRALDQAVCDAYGWSYDVLDDEESMLRKLLALNLERADA